MFKFNLFFMMICVILLSGCSQKNLTPTTTKKYDLQNDPTYNFLSKRCREDGDYLSCKELGDYLYDISYSMSAIVYNYACARYQYVDACMHLANMFENGIGVVKSKSISDEIYTRSCYSGNKNACKKMHFKQK